MIRLDRNASTPLYRQLADQLREKIERGELLEGQPLPAIQSLMENSGVGAAVERKALKSLEEEGWVVRRAGSEAMVSRPKPILGVQMGWDPAALVLDAEGPHEVRVLSKSLTTLPEELLGLFDIHGKSSRKAFRIAKLHLVDGQPKALEMIMAPSNGLRGLLMNDHRHQNIYRMVEEDYNLSLVRIHQMMHVRMLTKDEAKVLDSTEDFPAMCVERTLYTPEGAVALVDWTIPGGRCGLVEEMSALTKKR